MVVARTSKLAMPLLVEKIRRTFCRCFSSGEDFGGGGNSRTTFVAVDPVPPFSDSSVSCASTGSAAGDCGKSEAREATSNDEEVKPSSKSISNMVSHGSDPELASCKAHIYRTKCHSKEQAEETIRPLKGASCGDNRNVKQTLERHRKVGLWFARFDFWFSALCRSMNMKD